jgi:hypothetical protein
MEQVANRFQADVAQYPELAWARPESDDDEVDDDDEGSEGEVSMCDLESSSESSDTESELDDDGDAPDDLSSLGGSGPPDEPPAPEPADSHQADLPEDVHVPRVRPLRAPRSIINCPCLARGCFWQLLVPHFVHIVHIVHLLSIG